MEAFKNYYQSYLPYVNSRPTILENGLKTVIKLQEEAGEVAEAILAFHGSQSKTDKIVKKGLTPRKALKEEFGDVITVAFNVALIQKRL